MIRIVIAGENIALSDLQGEQEITTTITVEGEDNSTLKKTLSGSLTLYGRAWELVKAALIDPVDGAQKEIAFKVYNDCHTPELLVFDGVFQGDTVDWCEGECYCTVTGVEKTSTSAAMDCIKSTLIYDDHDGFMSRTHPRMVYCDEIRPEWLHHVVLILGIFAMLVLDILTPIVYMVLAIASVINVLIDAVNLIPGVDIDRIDLDGDPDTNLFEEWQNTRNRIRESLIGCGRVHPSPLVRSYIMNVCTKCGIGFSSSILNDPSSEYYNTVLWNAPVEKGTRDPGVKYIYQNRPIMTGDVLLDKLKYVFNAKYGVKMVGAVPQLFFERKDHEINTGLWVDPMQLKEQGRLIGSLCYSWSSEAPAAFATIGFSEDALDEPGNEARDYYKDVVEWNQPFNPVQKGEKQVQFQFGMLRCRRDGVGGDILDSYRFYPAFTAPINQFGHAMMVSRGISGFPKLLIANRFDEGDAEVVRGYDRPGTFKPPDKCYNFPYWVSEYGTAPNTAYPADAPNLNIYGRFHAIDNPKVLSTRRLSWKFEFEYTGSELASMNPYAEVPLPVGGGVYTGRITSITVNHTKGTILVAGKA